MIGNFNEAWLKDTIAGSIRSAIADVATAVAEAEAEGRHVRLSLASAQSKRFVACLGEALHQASRKAFQNEPNPIRSHYLDKSGLGGAQGPEFLWDIFIGQYDAAKSGKTSRLLRGIWAVESELHRAFHRDFDKLMVAHVEHRLFILPTGTRAVNHLLSQCHDAKVSCWIAEVDPLVKWRAEEDFMPWMKLQFVTAGG